MEVTQKTSKTVLYVITKATWGGAQKYVYDLMVEAKRQGLSPALAYGTPGILSERTDALQIPLIQIKGLGRDISIFGDITAFFILLDLLKKTRPNVLHLNSSKASFLGALAGRIAGVKKIIFTAHGWAFTESRNIISKIFFLKLHYLTVLLSHITIANSKATASYTKYWPFVGKKVHVVYPGIDSVDYIAREDARAALIQKDPSLAHEKDALWVGTIAELHKNKGLDIGVAAWKRAKLQKAQWVILGGGEEASALQAQARTTDHVHFLGFTPDASTCLKAFDVFLLPSRTESFGYVLLEAGLAGLPVIATSVGGIPEIVSENAGILAPKENREALAAALTTLTNDSGKRTEMGETLKEQISLQFPLSKMLEKTTALY